MSAWDRLNDKLAAEQAARALDEALGRGRNGRAFAVLLAESWYVVTSEAGGGTVDLAYDAGDVDVSDVSRSGWDYATWSAGMVPCTDRRVAAEYYLREGCLLGDAERRWVLSDAEVRVLRLVRPPGEDQTIAESCRDVERDRRDCALSALGRLRQRLSGRPNADMNDNEYGGYYHWPLTSSDLDDVAVALSSSDLDALRAALMDCAHVATAGKDLDAVRAEINAINRATIGPLPHVRPALKGSVER